MVDGNDLLETYRVFVEAVERARSGGGPTVIETRIYRITPHSSDDDDRSYRTREEVEENKRKDGLIRARTTLERDGVLTPKALEEMEAKAKEMVDDAVRYAEEAPYPDPEEALFPVYAEDIPMREEAPHA
jgi:2-oxoisovalerate dehydrogenase E1 component alpha subunit